MLCAASSLQAGTPAPKAPVAIQTQKGDGNVIFGSHDRRDGANYSNLVGTTL